MKLCLKKHQTQIRSTLLPSTAHPLRYLQVRLCVCGQEGLSGARQEGLSRRNERPRGSGPWLAEVQQAHGTGRLQGGPHRPLSREHGLLSLLIKSWSGLGEW